MTGNIFTFCEDVQRVGIKGKLLIFRVILTSPSPGIWSQVLNTFTQSLFKGLQIYGRSESIACKMKQRTVTFTPNFFPHPQMKMLSFLSHVSFIFCTYPMERRSLKFLLPCSINIALHLCNRRIDTHMCACVQCYCTWDNKSQFMEFP